MIVSSNSDINAIKFTAIHSKKAKN